MYRTILVFGLLAIVPVVVMAEDVGNTPQEAKKTSQTGRIKETLSSAADVDFYRFSVRADRQNPQHDTSGNLTVNFSQKPPPGINPQSGWRVELYSENDLAHNLYTAILPETSTEVQFEQGLSPGNYYYKISSLDSVVFPAVEYTFKGTWEESTNFEKPGNDKSDTATVIKVNEHYYGNLSSVSDADLYRFSLEVPDLVTITLSQDIPGIDPSIGWQFGLVSQHEQAVDIFSTKLSGVLQVNLDVGVHYLFVMALPPTQGEPRAPVGRRYQIIVNAASVLPPQTTECPFVFTYAQNPQTHRWATFPTLCDVPAGWFSQPTPPENSEVCPSPHAVYTPPLVKEDGTPQAGILKIPLVDIFNEEQELEIIIRAEMQEMPRPAEDSPYQFDALLDKVKLIRVVKE